LIKESWNLLLDPLMGTCLVEVGYMRGRDAAQMALAQNEQMIQTFTPGTAQKLFTDRIRFRRMHRRFEQFDPSCSPFEQGAKLGVVSRSCWVGLEGVGDNSEWGSEWQKRGQDGSAV
jgi:hypothetical protein